MGDAGGAYPLRARRAAMAEDPWRHGPCADRALARGVADTGTEVAVCWAVVRGRGRAFAVEAGTGKATAPQFAEVLQLGREAAIAGGGVQTLLG